MRRNVFLVFCSLLFFTSCSDSKKVSIQKVEHFYISSSDALSTFEILTELGLPIVWDYQQWGSFSSGGITLGNVVIELIESPPTQAQTYYGIALEPNQSLKGITSFLDSANISHGRISRASKWSTMSLTNLLPEDINLFLCDYHDREFITLDRKKAADQLVKNKGGALGILYLKELTIGTQTPLQFENGLAKLPGVVRKESGLHFAEGPSLKLIKSDSPSFALLIRVKSIDKAQLALETRGLKTRVTEEGVEIIDKVFSTKITLVE